ncbi:MAG: DUF6485 family protein [Bacillota bacterium]
MKCENYNLNLDNCNCTYDPCPRKGKCCECIKYHQKRDELPACYFSKEAEKTYNRSIDYFITLNS